MMKFLFHCSLILFVHNFNSIDEPHSGQKSSFSYSITKKKNLAPTIKV